MELLLRELRQNTWCITWRSSDRLMPAAGLLRSFAFTEYSSAVRFGSVQFGSVQAIVLFVEATRSYANEMRNGENRVHVQLLSAPRLASRATHERRVVLASLPPSACQYSEPQTHRIHMPIRSSFIARLCLSLKTVL